MSPARSSTRWQRRHDGATPRRSVRHHPADAQGVHVGGTRTVGTSFARVIGISLRCLGAKPPPSPAASIGGAFLPVIFPVNITDCEGNGNLGLPQGPMADRQPDGAEASTSPIGTDTSSRSARPAAALPDPRPRPHQENCDEEVTNPPPIQWDTFPVDVATDNGNNCAKKMVDEVNALHGKVVLIPICDTNDCNTSGGSHGVYHVSGVTAFYIDYMDDSNNKNNSIATRSHGQLLTISGNGSSSCIAGWFIRSSQGPVGAGPIGNGDAIGVQLIK